MQEKTIHHIAVGYLATNCWIYPLDGGPSGNGSPPDGKRPCAVIDPGDEGSHILDFLDSLQLFPQFILLTHGHFDHTTAAPFLAGEYARRFSGTERANIKIGIHEADKVFLDNDFPASLHLAEGDQVGPFTVLHLPGHSPGSIGLWDKDAGLLFSGDTLFCNGYGRTDLQGGSEAQLFSSLKRLFALDGSIQVYPGHGEATTIGAESAAWQ